MNSIKFQSISLSYWSAQLFSLNNYCKSKVFLHGATLPEGTLTVHYYDISIDNMSIDLALNFAVNIKGEAYNVVHFVVKIERLFPPLLFWPNARSVCLQCV